MPNLGTTTGMVLGFPGDDERIGWSAGTSFLLQRKDESPLFAEMLCVFLHERSL